MPDATMLNMNESSPESYHYSFETIERINALALDYEKFDKKVMHMISSGVTHDQWLNAQILNSFINANEINIEPDSLEDDLDRNTVIATAKPCAEHYDIPIDTLVDDFLLCISMM
jgi:hypothetical protein